MKTTRATTLCSMLAAAAAANAGQATNDLSGTCLPLGRGIFGLQEMRTAGFASIESAFLRRFDENGSSTLFDKFDGVAVFDWIARDETDGYAYVAEYDKVGRDALQNSAVSSLRDTVTDLPGIEENHSFVVNLFKDTIGNSREESLSPYRPTVSASEITWEEEWKKDEGFSYGLRPFNDRPYAYESAAIRDGYGRIRWYENLRIRYEPFDHLRLEGQAVVPLSASWQMDVGADADPMHVGGQGSGSGLSIGLSRIFKYAQTLSFGASMDETGHAFFAGAFFRRF